MFKSESGFTTAALGFVVFAVLLGVIFVSRTVVENENSQEYSPSPALSLEASASSITPKTSAKPSPSSSSTIQPSISDPSPSSTNQPTNVPNQTSSTSPTGKFIRITSPNGGESYNVGAHLLISWEYNEVQNCTIRYQTEDGSTSSFFVPVNAEDKQFSLPLLSDYLGPLEQVKIKVVMGCDENISDSSDHFFTITK